MLLKRSILLLLVFQLCFLSVCLIHPAKKSIEQSALRSEATVFIIKNNNQSIKSPAERYNKFFKYGTYVPKNISRSISPISEETFRQYCSNWMGPAKNNVNYFQIDSRNFLDTSA